MAGAGLIIATLGTTWGATLAVTLPTVIAAPAAADVPLVQVQETAANLANLKMLLGTNNNVTFVSDLPGQPEAADSLTAFRQTKRGESALIVSPLANVQRLEPEKEVAFYEDAGLTQLSDLVVLYANNRGREAIGFTSDVPEPAGWATMLAGFSLAGLALRARTAPPRLRLRSPLNRDLISTAAN